MDSLIYLKEKPRKGVSGYKKDVSSSERAHNLQKIGAVSGAY